MGLGTAVDTSDDVHPPQLVERMLGPGVRQAGCDAAPLFERAGCRAAKRRPDPNDPDGRSSQMPLFFLVAAPEIETPERAQWRDLPQPREAARRGDEYEKAATTPKQNDPKFLRLLRPSNRFALSRGASRGRTERRRLQRGVGRRLIHGIVAGTGPER